MLCYKLANSGPKFKRLITSINHKLTLSTITGRKFKPCKKPNKRNSKTSTIPSQKIKKYSPPTNFIKPESNIKANWEVWNVSYRGVLKLSKWRQSKTKICLPKTDICSRNTGGCWKRRNRIHRSYVGTLRK